MKSSPISRILLGLAAALVLSSVSSAEVLKIVVNDTIQPITAGIHRPRHRRSPAPQRSSRIDRDQYARRPGRIHSPHHREDHEFVQVPVILYVAPSGSRAGSAGIFILEAADVAAMAPGTNAGAAHPVLLFGPIAAKLDDEMKRKIENDTAALMRSVVSRRGRNVEVAESAVLESKSFTEQEALVAAPDRLRGLQRRRSFPPDGRQELSSASTARKSLSSSPASPSCLSA